MLVLSRKVDEKIVIGKGRNRIVITILRIQGNEKVSVGIEADREMFPVFRYELLGNEAEEEERAPVASTEGCV